MTKDSIIKGYNNTVTIDGKVLSPDKSFKYRNHSPDGFAWGYGGSGPSQLALALLLEATSDTFAVQYYQDLKRDIISQLSEEFEIKGAVILDWVMMGR